MGRKTLLFSVILLVAMSGGIAAIVASGEKVPNFHDMLVMPSSDFIRLVDGEDREVVAASGNFRTYQDAYEFVRDRIAYSPYVPAGSPAKALKLGEASCLGKAALLCSLYRAMGADPSEVRVVTGLVNTPEGLAEHAWVDLEFMGACYQQDPSGFLGRFEFDEFYGGRFRDKYVLKEILCFNDQDFGVVSQRNRFK